MDDFAAKQSRWFAPTSSTTATKPKGRGGFLTSLISEGGALGGGLAGASAGTAIGGPIGTLIGGGIGAGLGAFGGRLTENKVRDDEYKVGEAAKEGAVSAVFGASPIKAAKGAGAAGKSLLKLESNAVAKEAAEKAISAPGIISKLFGKGTELAEDAAKHADMKTLGVEVGQKVRGRTILSDEANAFHDFAREGSKKYAPNGIQTGTPLKQAKQAQEVLNGATKALNDRMAVINRDVVGNEVDDIFTIARKAAEEDASITVKDMKTLSKLEQAGKKQKDLAGLEDLRKKADDIAYAQDKAGKTSAAAQARHVREAIDSHISNIDEEYKVIKGDWMTAKDLATASSQASKKASGSVKNSQNIVGALLGNQPAQGAVSKVAGGVGGVAEMAQKAEQPIGFASRILAGKALTSQPQDNKSDLQASIADLENDNVTREEGLPTSDDPFSSDNVSTSVEKIISQGGTMKDVQEYLSNAKLINELTGGAKKAPTAAVAQTLTDLEAGIANIRDLGGKIKESSGNVPFLGSVLSNVPNSSSKRLRADIDRVKQVIGKALEGGVLRKEDEEKYKKILPTVDDTDEDATLKIDAISTDLERKLDIYKRNLGSGGGGVDLSSLINSMSAGGTQ